MEILPPFPLQRFSKIKDLLKDSNSKERLPFNKLEKLKAVKLQHIKWRNLQTDRTQCKKWKLQKKNFVENLIYTYIHIDLGAKNVLVLLLLASV